MKKIIALISAVVLIPVVASAQRFEYDGIELVHGNRVESSIKLVFPMYFGVTAVPGYNFATAPGWKANTDYRPMKNFHYGLEIASLRFYSKASHMETSLGLRWDFMNIYPSDLGDRMRATYFGVPLRFAYKAGRGKIFCGAAAQYLVSTRNATDPFNSLRASVEAGYAYGLLGFYVNYGATPLFMAGAGTAHSLSFGLTLGI